MNGTGTATLSQANTYTGSTTINAGGIVKVTAASSGLGTAGITVNSGGELLLSGATLSSGNTLAVTGTGVSSAGALATSGGTANVLNGTLTLSGAATLGLTNSSDSLSVAGINGGGFGLTVKGAGNLTQTAAFIGTGAACS